MNDGLFFVREIRVWQMKFFMYTFFLIYFLMLYSLSIPPESLLNMVSTGGDKNE